MSKVERIPAETISVCDLFARLKISLQLVEDGKGRWAVRLGWPVELRRRRSDEWPPFGQTDEEALTKFCSAISGGELCVWRDNEHDSACSEAGFSQIVGKYYVCIDLRRAKVTPC